jgi:hypothetical protein
MWLNNTQKTHCYLSIAKIPKQRLRNVILRLHFQPCFSVPRCVGRVLSSEDVLLNFEFLMFHN